MIAIEVNGKRVECDNEKEARKALARAGREQKAEERRLGDLRRLANDRASIAFYAIIRQCDDIENNRKHAIAVCRPGMDAGDYEREHFNACVVKDRASYTDLDFNVTLNTPDGDVTINVYKATVDFILQDGCGWDRAYRTTYVNDDGTKTVRWYFVGAAERQFGLCEVDGALAILLDQFISARITYVNEREARKSAA